MEVTFYKCTDCMPDKEGYYLCLSTKIDKPFIAKYNCSSKEFIYEPLNQVFYPEYWMEIPKIK